MWKTERYYEGYETTFGRDGTGQELKRSQRIYDSEEEEWGAWESSYFINSSVLGQTVSETTSTGKKKFTYVIGAGNVIARQAIDDEDDEYVSWEHRDASGFSSRASTASSIPTEVMLKPEEMDALGNNVGTAPALTIRPRGNSNSPNEPTAFDDPNAGDCNSIGVYGGCFRDSPFALNNDGLPREIGQAARTGRDSYTIARDVMRSIYGPMASDNAPRRTRIPLDDVAPSEIDEWWEDFFEQDNSSGGRSISTTHSQQGKCTVNVNIRNLVGLSNEIIDGAKAELSKIYGEAGVDLIFNSDRTDVSTSVNLWLVASFPEHIVNELKVLGYKPEFVAGFQSGRYFGNTYLRVTDDGWEFNDINGYSLGRYAAHEIGHRLLYGWETKEYGKFDGAKYGIMSYYGLFGMADLAPDDVKVDAGVPPPFSFLPREAEFLSKCNFANRSVGGY